jgi:MFS family permease
MTERALRAPRPPEARKASLREQLAAARLLLANRDLAFFLATRFLATFGLRMVTVAVGWELYERTHDPMSLGLVGLASLAPAVMLLLPAGALADHGDRRRIAASAFALMAVFDLCFARLSAGGIGRLWPLYGAMFGLGTALSLYRPSASAMLPTLVPREQLLLALAWSSSALRLGSILGPAAGGFLYLVAPRVVYVAAAGLSALGAVLTALIRMRDAPRVHASQNGRLGRLGAGLRFIGHRQVLLGTVTLDLFSSVVGGVTALLPIFARDILAAGPAGLGALRSAPAVGATLMGLAFTVLPLNRRGTLVMFGTVALSGLATIAFGLSRSLPLSLATLTAMGALDQASDSLRQTLVQLATPDEMRGRVNAVQQLSGTASNGLGDFLSGAAAAWIGVVPAVTLGGLAAIAIGGLWARLFPALRRIDRLTDVTV